MMQILYTIIIYPVIQAIEFCFAFSQKLFRETGVSIIFISIAINVLCLPLYAVAEKWQRLERDIQRKLKPGIDKIKAVFKKDEQYLILSTFYRQNHYHPVYAMRSTFGLLIQIPFFIAAYSYLSHFEIINNVPFFFINDLGKPDALLSIGRNGGGGGAAINILPILMTLINCVSGAVYTRGLPIKDKLSLYGMAVVFLLFLYNSPSALVLYWTMNNVFSLAKNGYAAIPWKHKRFCLYGLVSLGALLLSWYAMFIHNGNPKVRVIIAAVSLLAALVPWALPLIIRLLKKIKHHPWTKKETLILFLVSLLILWTATGLFIPSMLINASPQEFSYIDEIKTPLFFIAVTLIQGFGLCVFWPLMIYLLFSEHIKKILSLAALIAAISAVCNVFVFAGSYGFISNELAFSGTVNHTVKEIAFNVLVLFLLAAAIFGIYIRGGKKILSFVSVILFIALGAFSIKNVFSINAEFEKLSLYYQGKEKKEDTIAPIFTLSKSGKNIIVIMLDMAESVFVPYIFDESPELYGQYDGFVYFPNTVTFNGWTRGGAPPIFGGYEYTPGGMNSRPDISLRQKNNEALLLMPRLFSAAGFSVVITDPPYADDNWIPDLRIFGNDASISGHITDGAYTDLWLKRNNIFLPSQSARLKRNILWYALFRELPFAFRQGVYMFGAWCAPFYTYNIRLNNLNGYAVLDYLDELTGIEQSGKDSILLMVNNTTHENAFMQSPAYTPRLNVTDFGSSPFSKVEQYHVNAASIKRLSEYFDFLKENDVYDNTRIILVSDHAGLDVSYVTKSGLPFPIDQFNPLLMVKDFNAKGAMRTDMTFMSNADVPSLAMDGVLKNPVNPFTGKPLSNNDNDKENPLLVLIKKIDYMRQNTEFLLDLNPPNCYLVHDNIFDEKNWSIAPQQK